MMLRNRTFSRLTFLTTVVIVGFACVDVWQLSAADKSAAPEGEKESAGVSLGDFQKLHKQLQIKDQPWAAIPWQLSITEARKRAAKENKPILLFTGNGHLLACG